MAGVTLTDYAKSLRAWHRGIAEWLGLDPKLVFAPHDRWTNHVFEFERSTLEPTEPVRGHWRGWSVSADSDYMEFTGSVALQLDEARELMALIGEKPQLLTREQELILRGLAAEAEDRRAR